MLTQSTFNCFKVSGCGFREAEKRHRRTNIIQKGNHRQGSKFSKKIFKGK